MISEHGLQLPDELVIATKEKRKTEARCVVLPQPDATMCQYVVGAEPYRFYDARPEHGDPLSPVATLRCPYGTPGSLLYIRQTWAMSGDLQTGPSVTYRADGLQVAVKIGALPRRRDGRLLPSLFQEGWIPSRLMPKAFAMIWLRLTKTNVQRLQNISPHELATTNLENEGLRWRNRFGRDFTTKLERYVLLNDFTKLWDSFYAHRGYGWEQNPWVWVLTYELLTTAGRAVALRLVAKYGMKVVCPRCGGSGEYVGTPQHGMSTCSQCRGRGVVRGKRQE